MFIKWVKYWWQKLMAPIEEKTTPPQHLAPPSPPADESDRDYDRESELRKLSNGRYSSRR